MTHIQVSLEKKILLKNWHRGVIISTKTILVLYDDLVKQGNYTFLLCC